MPAKSGPGRKPKRLYVRLVRFEPDVLSERGLGRSLSDFVEEFDRVGRLVGHGPLTRPTGDFLVFRASDRAEAERVLRTDPLRALPNAAYEVLEWNPSLAGTGVSLEPPPARGSGRLTFLQRVPVIVRDQAKAIAWYRDVLGLSVVAEDPDTHYVELALGPGAAAISLIAPRLEWGEPYYSETKARLGIQTGIVFQTDSVEALELRLRHAGTKITRGVELQPWGERTILFSDPDGNQFSAFDRRPDAKGRKPVLPSR
ncbi:MAG TPA: VOC family protein [Thermoplasmata archaeon]|nr:VOC family protein [Thermoplasmata archaeon]